MEDSSKDEAATDSTGNGTEELNTKPEEDQATTPLAAAKKAQEVKETPISAPKPSRWKFWKWSKKVIFLVMLPLLLISLSGIIYAVPVTRQIVQNALMTANVNVKVQDSKTEQPLVGVMVTTDNGVSVETDEEGMAVLEEVGFGDLSLTFTKETYETQSLSIGIEKSETDLDTINLVPTGKPFSVSAVDAVSGESVEGFSASIEGVEDSSVDAEDGVAVLNVPIELAEEFSVTISADGFNDATTEVEDIDEEFEVNLVASGKTFFLSNKDGNIGVYSSDLDGTERKLIVPGTGTEEQYNTFFTVAPNGKYGILSASRKGERNEHKNLVNELYVVDFEKESIELFDEGASSWQVLHVGDDITTYLINKGDSSLDDNRKIKTFTFSTKKIKTLATESSLEKTRYEDGYVVYAVREYKNGNYYEGFEKANFSSINVSTGKSVKLETKQLIQSVRVVSPSVLTYSAKPVDEPESDAIWVEYTLSVSQRKVLPSRPDDSSFVFTASPDEKSYAWLDSRDGKNTILISENGEDGKAVELDLNVTSILRWISEDRMIVLVGNTQHVVDIKTAKSMKVTDVYQYQHYYGHGF